MIAYVAEESQYGEVQHFGRGHLDAPDHGIHRDARRPEVDSCSLHRWNRGSGRPAGGPCAVLLRLPGNGSGPDPFGPSPLPAFDEPEAKHDISGSPTVLEKGYDFAVVSGACWTVPAATPKEIQQKLENALLQSFKDPVAVEVINKWYMVIEPIDGESLQKMIFKDYQINGELMKHLGLGIYKKKMEDLLKGGRKNPRAEVFRPGGGLAVSPQAEHPGQRFSWCHRRRPAMVRIIGSFDSPGAGLSALLFRGGHGGLFSHYPSPDLRSGWSPLGEAWKGARWLRPAMATACLLLYSAFLRDLGFPDGSTFS